MTVDEFADILRDREARIEAAGIYKNHNRTQGYWANLVCHSRRYWFSVSASREPASPTQVAAAITSPNRIIMRSGTYKKGRGFEATVNSNDRSYMLGHGEGPHSNSNRGATH